MLDIGTSLPKFSMTTQNGDTVNNHDLKGHYSVIYFYPKDDTPGCTREACDFTERLPEFDRLSVPVYGVSPDTQESHKKFSEKYKLKVTLLADPEKKFCDAVGVIGERNLYGKIVVGVIRTTLIIDPQGKIIEIFKNVRVDGHIETVRDRIQKLIERNNKNHGK